MNIGAGLIIGGRYGLVYQPGVLDTRRRIRVWAACSRLNRHAVRPPQRFKKAGQTVQRSQSPP
jgi:hypothetical protein